MMTVLPFAGSHLRRWVIFIALAIIAGPHVSSALPRLHVSVSDTRPVSGHAFLYRVDIRWGGTVDRYVLYEPRLTLPAGVSIVHTDRQYLADGEETVYTYDYQLAANSPGETDLGPLELDYRAMGAENEGLTSDEATPTIKSEVVSVHVQPSGTFGALVRLFPPIAVLLAGAFFLWNRRGRRNRPQSPAEMLPVPSVHEYIREATDAMHAGQFADTYALLIKIKPLIPSNIDPLPPSEHLENERLRLRYGGQLGSVGELEGLMRAVKQAAR